ncbi:hypothetical protein GOV03_02735, partial [Candidatus Woesearchaeota archaeon]|nr:hypothetical protein [Candidatus Woesearchaeota archaeon]
SETTGPAEESVVSGAAITGAVVAEAGIAEPGTAEEGIVEVVEEEFVPDVAVNQQQTEVVVYSDSEGILVNKVDVEPTPEPEETTDGEIELDVQDLDDGTYTWRTSTEEITIEYKKVYVEMFNPTSESVAFSQVSLVDNLGNSYEPSVNDPDPTLDVPRFNFVDPVTKNFVRNGYLFFLDVSKSASTLTLIFEFGTGQEKREFEFSN